MIRRLYTYTSDETSQISVVLGARRSFYAYQVWYGVLLMPPLLGEEASDLDVGVKRPSVVNQLNGIESYKKRSFDTAGFKAKFIRWVVLDDITLS